MPQPRFLSFSMIPNRWLTSFSDSEEVGSSMMTIFALYENALAISIICICDTVRSATFWRGSTSMSSSSKMAFVSRYIFAWSMNGPRCG